MRKNKQINFAKKIQEYSPRFWLPSNEPIINVNSNSWFNIQEKNSNHLNNKFNAKLPIPRTKMIRYAEKIRIYPTKKQRRILLNWMNSYIRMYNEALRFIKRRRIMKKSTITNWKIMRTKHLKDIKANIIKKSAKVNAHVLDGAIQDVCSHLKSCITNLQNDNIKHFRLRYLKFSKKSKIIKIENNCIKKDKTSFCPSVFKNKFILKKITNGKVEDFNLGNITSSFYIHYNKDKNEFTLLNPIKTVSTKLHSNRDTISLDPGIRTFQTGYSTNKCVEIGTNLKSTIKKHLDKIDKIDKIKNDDTINKRTKNKIKKKNYRKISNKIDDLHWKSINYLTKNYGNILIGNLSTKSIVKKNNNIDKMTKRIGLLMRLYIYKQRLAYKCERNKLSCNEIDEAYTSVTCTNCGFYKKDLGNSHIYNCDKCKHKIGRDFAGARNILINSLKTKK